MPFSNDLKSRLFLNDGRGLVAPLSIMSGVESRIFVGHIPYIHADLFDSHSIKKFDFKVLTMICCFVERILSVGKTL